MKKVIVPVVVLASLIIYGVAQAGSLTPTAAPAATMFTLDNIFNRLNTNATAVEGDHVFAPAASPAGTLRTLVEIYQAIPTILAETIKLGTSYLGIAGTLTPDGGTATAADLFSGVTTHLTNDWDLDTGTLILACDTDTFDGTANLVDDNYDGDDGDGSNRWCIDDSGTATSADIRIGTMAWVNGVAIAGSLNPDVDLTQMYSGSGQGYDGGTQDDGGIDDWNANGSASSGRYSAAWTTCSVGNNWCDTGLTSALAQDNNSGLVWSQNCYGVGCSSFSDANAALARQPSPPSGPLVANNAAQYSWDNSSANNDSLTANELCSAGNHGESGWSLPNQKQLMQAYVNGAWENMEPIGSSRTLWSGTTVSYNTAVAWQVFLGHGEVRYYNKTATGNANFSYVRCVR